MSDIVRRLEAAADTLARDYRDTIQSERAAELRRRETLLREAATEIEVLRERLAEEVAAQGGIASSPDY